MKKSIKSKKDEIGERMLFYTTITITGIIIFTLIYVSIDIFINYL